MLQNSPMTYKPELIWICLIVFAAAAAVAYACTAVSIYIAHRHDCLDHPGQIKLHGRPVPFLGGAAIFTAFWTVFGACYLVLTHRETFTGVTECIPIGSLVEFAIRAPQMVSLFIGGLFIVLVGLIDDKYALKPTVKFVGQTLVAIFMVRSGFELQIFQSYGIAGDALSVLWIVLLLNAFNFIDSINGHCAGVVMIMSGAFFLISQSMHQPVLGLMMIVLGGSILGFMPFNFHHAKTFLGDNGSLFLGYMMAAASMLATYRVLQPVALAPIVPLFIFGVPIYDLISVMCVRLYRGQRPWKGDRNHFAHRLIRMGLDGNDAVLFSYLVAITTSLLAVLATQVPSLRGGLIILLLYFMILMIIAILEYHSACYIDKKMAVTQDQRGTG